MTTTALVTGVGGQDGILAARRLVGEGLRVVGTVRPGWQSPLSVYLDGVEIVELDLCDAEGMRRLVAEARPDEIYHFAGISSVRESWDDPDLVRRVNDDATGTLLAAVAEHVAEARVVLASSAEVFGPDMSGVVDESTPLAPASPYAESKVRVMERAAAARDAGGFAAAAVLFNHESAIRGRQFVTRKISRAVAAIAEGGTEPLVLGNLDVARDWGAAVDTIDALVRMARAEKPRDVLVATGRLRTIRELVDAAFAAGGIDDPWAYVTQDPALMRMADTPGRVADITLARTWLGWEPTTTFDQLVSTMVETDVQRLRSGVEESPAYLQ